MVNNTVYNNILSWFDDYTRPFLDSDPVEKCAATLKSDHTHLVVKNNKLLCETITIDNELRCLSDIIALLHDIGRFEQFKKYRTFADRHSVNHACLGIEIIEQHNVLKELNNEHQKLIKNAILLHNAPSLPPETSGTQKLLCQLIRDSDKLDIYRIVSEYYKNPDSTNREIIGIGISEENTISDEIISAISAKECIDYSILKSMNDFKLVQLGWVFDLNFPMSIYLITERNHFYDIRNALPNHERINSAVDVIEQHVKNVLSGFTPPVFF
jgi:HD domain